MVVYNQTNFCVPQTAVGLGICEAVVGLSIGLCSGTLKNIYIYIYIYTVLNVFGKKNNAKWCCSYLSNRISNSQIECMFATLAIQSTPTRIKHT